METKSLYFPHFDKHLLLPADQHDLILNSDSFFLVRENGTYGLIALDMFFHSLYDRRRYSYSNAAYFTEGKNTLDILGLWAEKNEKLIYGRFFVMDTLEDRKLFLKIMDKVKENGEFLEFDMFNCNCASNVEFVGSDEDRHIINAINEIKGHIITRWKHIDEYEVQKKEAESQGNSYRVNELNKYIEDTRNDIKTHEQRINYLRNT